MTRPKLIAGLKVKDEIKLIHKWLERTCECVDEIVVLDNGSTDGTYELLRDHPMVKRIIRDKPGTPYHDKRMRNIILKLALERNADWILFIDADEILDVRFPAMRDELMMNGDVAWYHFREITLWKSTAHYRVDRPDWYMRRGGYCRLVRVVPGLRWDIKNTFGLRKRLFYLIKKRNPRRAFARTIRYWHATLYGAEGKIVHLDDLVRLHYHFVDWDKCWRRAMQDAISRAIEHRKQMHEIDALIAKFTQRMDESGLTVAPVNPAWGVL